MDALVLSPLLDGEPFVAVTRGTTVESVHRVAACAVDRSGRTVLSLGTTGVPVFLRSTAKPFIAAAAVREGIVERFGLEPYEIATMAGSHNAESFHLEAVRSILHKIGVAEEALACGPHAPYDPVSANALVRAGIPFAPIHNNCSGKHAGILALCKVLGAPLESYFEAGHPAQRAILAFCARACGLAVDDLRLGVDGCGIPVFAASLRSAALAFARLAVPEDAEPRDGRALRAVRDAMIAFPQYVAGTGEFDTALMLAADGRAAVKSGAEGAFGLADLRGGCGLALKVIDGTSRACAPAALEVVRRLGLLDAETLAALGAFACSPVRSRAGAPVGTIAPVPAAAGAVNDDERRRHAGMAADYDLLERQARALLAGERDLIANAANFAAFLYGELPDVSWLGFYLLDPCGDLVLGPFAGKPACSRLPRGRGVCGAAVTRRETIVVDDVGAFADHIVCDPAARSEIAVPIVRGGQPIGVLDVDSASVARFSPADRRGLEALARAFEAATTW